MSKMANYLQAVGGAIPYTNMAQSMDIRQREDARAQQEFLQKQQELQNQRAQQAALYKAMSQTPTGGAAPTAQGLPGAQKLPSGMAPTPRQEFPSMDDVMKQLSTINLPDDQKMAVMGQYMGMMQPYQKMQQQMELKQMQMQNQFNLLGERMNFMKQMQDARIEAQKDIWGGKKDTATAARDASTIAKEVSDQRALVTSLLNAGAMGSDEYKTERARLAELQQEQADLLKKGAAPKPMSTGNAAKMNELFGGDSGADPLGILK